MLAVAAFLTRQLLERVLVLAVFVRLPIPADAAAILLLVLLLLFVAEAEHLVSHFAICCLSNTAAA